MTTKQLDEGTRRALLAGQDPPAGAQERVLRAILAAGPTGGGEPGEGADPLGGGELASLPRGVELGFAAKVVGATLGLTATGLVTLALVSAGVRTLREPERSPTHAREVAPAAPRETASAPAPREDEQPSEPLVAPEPSAALEASAPVVRTPSPVASEPAEAATTTSLEAELALMQEAREAETPAAKLELLDRHAREHAQGVLADEREVLRVETLCALGRKGEAEALAAAFVAAKPSNPLRSRVEPACEK